MTESTFEPASQDELRDWLRRCSETISIRGGGNAPSLGGYVEAKQNLTLSKMRSVIDYPSKDMTITIQCGMTVAELAQQLLKEGQRLPIEVPNPETATIGGILAVNASGPLRYGYGTLRDYLIGISAVDISGKLFHAGGRVVKNVAGYDLCKLMIGSLGTLAILTEATFKLKPLPESSGWVLIEPSTLMSAEGILQKLLSSAARPCALELLDERAGALLTGILGTAPPRSPILCAGVEGTEREVEWQLGRIAEETKAEGSPSIHRDPRIREWFVTKRLVSDSPVIFKANLPSSQVIGFVNQARHRGVTIFSHVANGIIFGHLPPEIQKDREAMAILKPLKEFLAEAQGNMTLIKYPLSMNQELAIKPETSPATAWMQKIKKEFDPDHRLNPGRVPF